MRALGVTIIAVAVAAGVLKQRNRAESDAPAQQTTVAHHGTTAPGEPSEHNWPKRALDRAADVKRQVAEQRNGDAAR